MVIELISLKEFKYRIYEISMHTLFIPWYDIELQKIKY